MKFAALCALALSCVGSASPLDLVLVFDRTESARPRNTDDLVSTLESGRRIAVASTVPEFRIHTSLQSDAAAVERALEEAVLSTRSSITRRPRLYEAAKKAAELFDSSSLSQRLVLFVTFNREKPSAKRTEELVELYRKQAIRLEVVVLPPADTRSGGRGPFDSVICDPGPGCPALQRALDPDRGTLDQVATALGGDVRRVQPDEKIDWHKLVADIESKHRAISKNKP